MKLGISILALLLVGHLAFSQDFPGYDPSILLGKTLKVKAKSPTLQQYGYEGFFKDDGLKKKFACCESYNSKYKSLAEKSFTVTEVSVFKEDTYNKEFRIKLNNSESGDFYYKYESAYEFRFPFEVIGGLTFPAGYYCKEVSTHIDKFKEDTTYYTPEADGVTFLKVERGVYSKYYIKLKTTGSIAIAGKTGAIILLENNTKLKRPSEKIELGVSESGKFYTYSAFFLLDNEELKMLLTTNITDFQLDIFDNNVKYGKRLNDYLNCLYR